MSWRVRILLPILAAVGLILSLPPQSAGAFPPIQNYTTFGAAAVNWAACYELAPGAGSPPVVNPIGGGLTPICGPGTSEIMAPLGAGVGIRSWIITHASAGDRYAWDFLSCPQQCTPASMPVTYTPRGPGLWGVDLAVVPCPPVGFLTNDCGAGAVGGNYQGQADFGCSGPPYDVVAPAAAGAPVGWPDPPPFPNWIPYGLMRSAASFPLTGGGAPLPPSVNWYTTQVNPFPHFGFESLDTGSATTVWLGGVAPFALPTAIPIQLYAGSSPWVPGLEASLLLIGDPEEPPTNDFTCWDTPQSTITEIDWLVPPAAPTLIPRWGLLQAPPDIRRDNTGQRVLDWQCVNVGGFLGPDVDGDCWPFPADTNDLNADQDGDGVPDGIEVFSGSSPVLANTDADGASDYDELFTFTNPVVADTDGDGSLDVLDNGSDENVISLFVDDTINDDNCPGQANADQLNTDYGQNYHGGFTSLANINPGPGPGNTSFPIGPIIAGVVNAAGTRVTLTTTFLHGYPSLLDSHVELAGVTGMVAGTAAQNNAVRGGLNGALRVDLASAGFALILVVNGPPLPFGAVLLAPGALTVLPRTGDRTNPDQDSWGDECDVDDDNDGLTDLAEAKTWMIVPWAGAGTTSCVKPGGPGTVPPVMVLNPKNGDTDMDLVLDGIECQMGSRPDIHCHAAACPAPRALCIPLDPNGCAQPAVPGVIDLDMDGLYGPSLPAFMHAVVEAYYRVRQVNIGGPQNHDGDGDGAIGNADKDSDADYLWTLNGVFPIPNPQVGLQDGVEVRAYGTEPAKGDTDTDGCDDLREVADVDGDFVVGPGDAALVANRVLLIGNMDNGLRGDPVGGDRAVNPWGINYDLNKDRVVNAGDQALLAFTQGKGGACQSPRQLGKTFPFPATKNP